MNMLGACYAIAGVVFFVVAAIVFGCGRDRPHP